MSDNFTEYNEEPFARLIKLQLNTFVTELIQSGQYRVVYNEFTGSWSLVNEDSSGQDSGIEFTIDANGQIYYTTTNQAGLSHDAMIRYKLERI